MQPDKEVNVFREMPEQIREVTKVEGSVVFTAVNRLQFTVMSPLIFGQIIRHEEITEVQHSCQVVSILNPAAADLSSILKTVIAQSPFFNFAARVVRTQASLLLACDWALWTEMMSAGGTRWSFLLLEHLFSLFLYYLLCPVATTIIFLQVLPVIHLH